MDRRILWSLVGSLVAFPVLASNPSTVLSSVTLSEASLACAGPANEEPSSAGVSYQPLSAEERISFSLAGLRKGILEARFLVDGNVYVLETFDLSKIELPRMVQVQEAKVQGIDPQALAREGARSLREAEKVIELLEREPDIVRELHRLAAGGSQVEIEILHDGKTGEHRSLDDFRGRTLKRNQVPVVAYSTVTGPGLEQKQTPRLIVMNDYLPNCGDCDYGIPCETECGYDPGKGGPVTCQEQGLPCGDPPTCECETSHGEYWTAWWEYDRVPTGAQQCFLVNSSGDGGRYARYQRYWKRNKIRRTFVCPNCPSCTGCYTRNDVIDTQYQYTFCWSHLYNGCFNPWQPVCCSALCNPFDPCGNFPCSY